MNNIKNRLTEVFKDVFDDEDLKITETTDAGDIEDWDSLVHVTLIGTIQKEFDISFNLEELQQIENVGDMIVNINKKINSDIKV